MGPKNRVGLRAHIGVTSVGCNDREWQSQASASKIGGVAIIPYQIAD